MITHLIKPGTVFFFNQSKPTCDIQAGVLMVTTARTANGNWAFRRLAGTGDYTAVIDGHRTHIWFKYDDSDEETFIGQLPPGALHVTEWKAEYLLSKRTQPVVTLTSQAVGLLKRLW